MLTITGLIVTANPAQAAATAGGCAPWGGNDGCAQWFADGDYFTISDNKDDHYGVTLHADYTDGHPAWDYTWNGGAGTSITPHQPNLKEGSRVHFYVCLSKGGSDVKCGVSHETHA